MQADTSAPLRASLGRARVPLATWLASQVRLRLSGREAFTTELPLDRLNEGMLEDIGLRADQMPGQRPDPLLLMRAGGGMPL
ncbi:hypothetical protein ACFQX4_13520 [Roseomonas sp. GCM10028921]